MYPISFSPALGDAFTVERPSWPLLFTAQLSVHDYDQLVKDGGRVQLWSDILRQDENTNAWEEADFQDSIPLAGRSPSQETSVKTLHLSISPPPSNDLTSHFSFTYRIAYSSGDITWLGAFRQDGILKMSQSHLDAFDGMHLHAGWTTGAIQYSQVMDIRDAVNSLEVAILVNPVGFRVCSVNPNRLAPHPRNVSLMFLIPLRQRYPLVLSPTYVVAASPGLSLSLVEGQYLTLSGSGSALLQVYDLQTDITTFIERLITHTKLDDWKLLSTDTKGKSITLALTRQEQPVHAITIPFWPSMYTNTNIHLNRRQLANLYTTHDIDQLALFLPQANQLHIFDKENSNGDDILIENSSAGGDFTISPIYRIPTTDQTVRQLQRNWGTAILTPYNKLSAPLSLTNDPRIHPTPFVSRYSEPTTCSSLLTCASSETMQSSIASFPPHAGKPCRKEDFLADHVDQLESICIDDNHIMLPPSTPNHPLTPQSTLSLFKSIFVSVKAIVHFFFKIFWDLMLPFGTYQSRQHSSPQECDDRQTEPSTNSLTADVFQGSPPGKGYSSLPNISSGDRVQITTSNIPRDEDGNTSQDIDDPDSAFLQDVEITKFSDSMINNTLISDDLGLPAQSTSRGKIFYAEVSGNERSDQATTAIILLPPMPDDVDKEVIDAIPPSSLDEALQRAVAFLDGSNPQCVISRVNLCSCDSLTRRQRPGHGGKDICHLLEYHLDRMDDKLIKMISISSPGSGGHVV